MNQFKQQLPIYVLVVLGFCGLGVLGLVLPRIAEKVADVGFDTFIPGHKQISQHLWLVPNSIDDGKTLAVTNGTTETTVQLCGVAVPGIDKPMGIAARDHLRELVSVGNGAIIMVPLKKNRNGHTLADVFITQSADEEIHLNSQIILDGLASVDAQEAHQCPQPDVLMRAKDIAQQR